MSEVLKVYHEVIEDVISNVREMFQKDDVGEHVLQELRQSWLSKLMASKAVGNQSEIEKEISNGNGYPKAHPEQVLAQMAPNNHVQTQVLVIEKMVPIKIILPVKPPSEKPPHVLVIQVPGNVLRNNQLQNVITGSIIKAIMDLPPAVASSVLQQHVNSFFSGQSQRINVINTAPSTITNPAVQNDGISTEDNEIEIEFVVPSCTKAGTNNSPLIKKMGSKLKIKQGDGLQDDELSDESPSDDSSLDDNKDEESKPEEIPLNSEDDLTDEDPVDLFDTENVVACQFTKVIRNRNKWKIHLKNGIMNLNGEDYVFEIAKGDAEW